MKNDFTKTNLFSCPIYKIRIDPNSYDKEKIINDIKYNKSLKNTRNEPHQYIGAPRASDIHHSYKDFGNPNFKIINYEKLITEYQEIFTKFFNKEISPIKGYDFKFTIVNYSAITQGQWLPKHNHIDSDFATIHYLNFKNGHSVTNFNNPANFLPFLSHIRPGMVNMIKNRSSSNSYFYDFFEFLIEEDDMFIFPGALTHEVPVQGPTKEPRITISTNIRIEKLV